MPKLIYLDLQEQVMKYLFDKDKDSYLMVENSNIAWEIERYNMLERLGYFDGRI